MQSPFLTHFYSHILTSNRTKRSPLENKVTDLPSPANAVGSDLILRGVSRGPLARAGVIFVEHSGRDRLVLRTGVLMGLGSPPRMSVQKIAQHPKPTRRNPFLGEREFVHRVYKFFPSLAVPLA